MKSACTRRVQSFWSASCPSCILFLKSHKTSRFVYIPPLCLAAEKIDLIYFSLSFCTNCFSYIKFCLFSDRFEVPKPCCSRSSRGRGGVSCRVLYFDFRERGMRTSFPLNLFLFFYRFFLFYFNSNFFFKKRQNNIISVVLTAAPNWALTESCIDKN